jgi:hypothetical protein
VLVPGGATFSQLLDAQLLRDVPLQDATVAGMGPAEPGADRLASPAPHPLLFTQPFVTPRVHGYVRGQCTPASTPPRAPMCGSAARPNAAPPRATRACEPVSTSRPQTRRLSAGQQQALDFLNRLGAELDENFTDDELRRVFRRFARLYHPDRHPSADAAERAKLSRLFAKVVDHHKKLQTAAERASEHA